ncbi:hypothetical protein AAVH_38852, partial [Aphelenchoides avenae]
MLYWRRPPRLRIIIAIVLLLAVVYVEEQWFSQISNGIANHYNHAVHVPISVKRSARDKK